MKIVLKSKYLKHSYFVIQIKQHYLRWKHKHLSIAFCIQYTRMCCWHPKNAHVPYVPYERCMKWNLPSSLIVSQFASPSTFKYFIWTNTSIWDIRDDARLGWFRVLLYYIWSQLAINNRWYDIVCCVLTF